MLKNFFYFITLIIFLPNTLYATTEYFGSTLCKDPKYKCIKINENQSWSELFPDDDQRDLIKTINRTNVFLEPGMVIAVPKKLYHMSILEFAPFPLTIKNYMEKLIVVDQNQLAWGAYDDTGKLVRWGPISAGTVHCIESPKGCLTPKGTFHIHRKKGKECYSKSLPETFSGEHGGAYMPYCMFFDKGFALHGSETLPGYNESHGCVRMFIEDARWLNEVFVDVDEPKNATKGTKLIIK